MMGIDRRPARRIGRWFPAALLLLCALARAQAPVVLELDGLDYEHRWSQAGQNEFTPAGQEDLQRWQDMLTLVVRDGMADGEALAGWGNRLLERYQQAGVIVRTDTRPATSTRPAEHLVVALLDGGTLVEAVFARLVLHDGAGMVVVRSRRAYGDSAAEEVGAWLGDNGAQVEQALMAWPLPPLDRITQLPQSP